MSISKDEQAQSDPSIIKIRKNKRKRDFTLNHRNTTSKLMHPTYNQALDINASIKTHINQVCDMALLNCAHYANTNPTERLSTQRFQIS